MSLTGQRGAESARPAEPDDHGQRAHLPFPRRLPRLFNAPIYRALLAEHAKGGEDACRAWLAARLLTTDPAAVLASIAVVATV